MATKTRVPVRVSPLLQRAAAARFAVRHYGADPVLMLSLVVDPSVDMERLLAYYANQTRKAA